MTMKGLLLGVQPLAETANPTLLVIDDEVEIREVIELYATALGFICLEAEDGVQGLAILEAQPIDLIVSDLCLPKLRGLEVLAAVRQKNLSIPFIVITGSPSRDETVQALRLGAFDFVERPFERTELQRTLSEAMAFSVEIQKSATLKRPDQPVKTDLELQLILLRHLAAIRVSGMPAALASAPRGSGRDHFVADLINHLSQTAEALQALAQNAKKAHDLAYLFRMMQGLVHAASSIGATEIEALGVTLERLYSLLRVKPRFLDETLRLRLVQANDLLVRLVKGEGDEGLLIGDFQGVINTLEATAVKFEGVARGQVAS